MLEMTIAIPTFRRPEKLANALTEVLAQVAALNAGRDPSIVADVLVVDNDPARSGQGIAADFAVRYVSEPRPGIAAVRNRSIAESPDARALLFLDDDEVPETDWLQHLVATYLATGADAVAGRVITRFPSIVDPWVTASGAFVRPVRVHRQTMREAATNNLLIDLRTVRALGLAFDERFGLTGGSDSLFTRQLTQRGGVIRWSQDAVVIEQEDAERFSKRWVLMRTFRFGNSSARVNIVTARSPFERLAARVTGIVRGAARVAAGGIRFGWGVVSRSLQHRARGLRLVYRGAGMIAGSVGYAFNEYGRRRRNSAEV